MNNQILLKGLAVKHPVIILEIPVMSKQLMVKPLKALVLIGEVLIIDLVGFQKVMRILKGLNRTQNRKYINQAGFNYGSKHTTKCNASSATDASRTRGTTWHGWRWRRS